MPGAEVNAILEAENLQFKILEKKMQFLMVKAPEKAIDIIAKRSAYCRTLSTEIFNSSNKTGHILRTAESINFNEYIHAGESYAVRVKRIQNNSPHLNILELEKKLGEIILKNVKGVKVNLDNPQKTFLGVITDNTFNFGLKMAEIIPKPFFYRTPRKKPFFHPSSLQPKLARCMVNLSRAREGHIVLDPFCGTGTILIEAGLMDIETVGIDLREDMVVGAKRNLTYYGVKNHNLIIANALKIPLKHVDRIVTDPPYGRCATTMGRTALEVFENCLNEAIDLLPPEGYICIASPKTLNIRDLGKAVGFKLVEKYSVYVHRSLTRDIAVLKRK